MNTLHDLHVEYGDINCSISELPYNVMITCTRADGWELWQNDKYHRPGDLLVASEFGTPALKLRVGDTYICGHPDVVV